MIVNKLSEQAVNVASLVKMASKWLIFTAFLTIVSSTLASECHGKVYVDA